MNRLRSFFEKYWYISALALGLFCAVLVGALLNGCETRTAEAQSSGKSFDDTVVYYGVGRPTTYVQGVTTTSGAAVDNATNRVFVKWGSVVSVDASQATGSVAWCFSMHHDATIDPATMTLNDGVHTAAEGYCYDTPTTLVQSMRVTPDMFYGKRDGVDKTTKPGAQWDGYCTDGVYPGAPCASASATADCGTGGTCNTGNYQATLNNVRGGWVILEDDSAGSDTVLLIVEQ